MESRSAVTLQFNRCSLHESTNMVISNDGFEAHMTPTNGTAPIVFEFTADELKALRKPLNGSGGFQTFLARLKKTVKKKSIILTPELAFDIVRHAETYKQGGFQGRLPKRLVEAAHSAITVERLVEKSIEAYVMALETINRLSIKYRMEAFAYLICNAWELLLKAKLLWDSPDRTTVYYKPKPGDKPKTITLDDCLGRLFTSAKEPVRDNIEKVQEIRNDCTHFLIDAIPKEVMGLFQVSVINYHKRLQQWFGISLSDRVSVGMMTIVYDFTPEKLDARSGALRRQLGSEAAEYLVGLQESIAKKLEELGGSEEFALSVDYQLVLTKNPSKADLSLSTGDSDKHARIVKVTRDSGDTHPFVHSQVAAAIADHTADAVSLQSYDIRCIQGLYPKLTGTDYYHRSTVRNAPKQFSQAFIDWLKAQLDKDPDFVSKCRQKAKAKKLFA